MITLSQLLSVRGFDPDRKSVKLVRDKDSRFDLEALRRSPWFDVYQQYQSRPVFDGCTQIVSFIGEDYPKSRFVGVYDVGPRRAATELHFRWIAHTMISRARRDFSTHWQTDPSARTLKIDS